MENHPCVGAPWENVGYLGVNEGSQGTLPTARIGGLKWENPCSAGVSTVERVTGSVVAALLLPIPGVFPIRT